MPTAYRDDIATWAEEQVALLRSGQLDRLDAVHLAREMARLGHRDRRELGNRLTHLMTYLLALYSGAPLRERHWKDKVYQQRGLIVRLLEEGPSLRAVFADEAWMGRRWSRARKDAQRRSPATELPRQLPWTVEQLLDEDFCPVQIMGVSGRC